MAYSIYKAKILKIDDDDGKQPKTFGFYFLKFLIF